MHSTQTAIGAPQAGTGRRAINATGALIGALAAAGALASPVHAAEDPLLEAFTQGTPSIEVRPRYEVVDQSGKSEARAATVRTLLGYSTKPIEGVGATLQFIDVAAIGSDYNSGLNGKTGYATILDPREVNVNQAYLSYAAIPDTDIRAGRQIIILDDARFVGNVDFRQNMQTFDAVTAVNKTIPDVKLFASYAFGIKDILNQYVSTRTFLTEASWTRFKQAQADAFSYWYGNQTANNQQPVPGAAACGLAGPQACNNVTYGARLHGTFDLPERFGFGYDATYAKQSSYDSGSSLIDAQYMHFGGKLNWEDYYIGGDYMVMGSNNGLYGFQTPMATKHAFNGWAEQFLTTPKQGLRSAYGTVGAKPFGVDLAAVYYRFTSDTGGLTFGHEADFSATYPFTKHISGGIQYATFHAENVAYKNTNAGWVFATIKY